MTVDGIDFFVSDAFGEGLYDSCKEVKFGTMNTRAIDFIGAGATNFRGDFKFSAWMINLYSLNSSLLQHFVAVIPVWKVFLAPTYFLFHFSNSILLIG